MRDKARQREAQRQWYQTVAKPRRAKWIEEHGPCAICGSSNRLEVDHINPDTKLSHNVWTWSEQRRKEELEKCQVLCHGCHAKKSVKWRHDTKFYDNMEQSIRPKSPPGMAWCYICKDFKPIDMFHKDSAKRWGVNDNCIPCRSKRRKERKSGHGIAAGASAFQAGDVGSTPTVRSNL